ncbi:MAG: phosphoenolpyruvate carboxylase [Pseudomonadota bacterium]
MPTSAKVSAGQLVLLDTTQLSNDRSIGDITDSIDLFTARLKATKACASPNFAKQGAPMTSAATLSPEDLISLCHNTIGELETLAAKDPGDNGVRRLAFQVFNALESNQVDVPTLRRAIKTLSDQALVRRAGRFRKRHLFSPAEIRKMIRTRLNESGVQTFQDFKQLVEQVRFGVVFTAHPTFANNANLRRAIGHFVDDGDAQAFSEALGHLTHMPPEAISLFEEHEEVAERLENARTANDAITDEILTIAREQYPDDWKTLIPSPISLATWVGYDLDGRTDIHWGQTLFIRLTEKAEQLTRYGETLEEVAKASGNTVLASCADELLNAAAYCNEQAEAFNSDFADPKDVVNAGNLLTADDPRKVVSLEAVIATLTKEIGTLDDDAALGVCKLRAAMTIYGLGSARIHLRVNAAQVRTALQADLGVKDTGGFAERTVLASASAKFAESKSIRTNLGSVFSEPMTARRQLMLCAQIIKHIDADTPIRFLIAECEAPATIMGAIYLARVYGVDHRLDISPLFETPDALESGGRLVERLLKEEGYRDYIRARGVLALQFGFSDSGRFMGQVSADMAIERIHILVARELAKDPIEGVKVVLFNTHGESMGRGGFPGSLDQRFDHLFTPWARARYAKEGLHPVAESSFQGGDGFLHFETENVALSTMGHAFSWAFSSCEPDKSDRFYQDINYSWDLYRAIKAWQEDLFQDPHYQTALGAFGAQLLPKTGSRKVKRQSGTSMQDAARSLRAIPNNAILQQLAIPANIYGGLGTAAAREPERFDDMVKNSPRLRDLATLAATARGLTALSVLRGYASLYDPSFWTVLARHSGNPETVQSASIIANALASSSVDFDLERLANHLSHDRYQFDLVLPDMEGTVPSIKECSGLYALHSMRQAMMMRAFLLITQLPSFSRRHDINMDDIIQKTLRLELGDVASTLERIFPLASDNANKFAAIIEPNDDDTSEHGYPDVHRSIIEPLKEVERTLKEITVGVAHYYDAFG